MELCLTAGVPLSDFWISTISELFIALRAYNNRQELEWERARAVTWNLLRVHVDGDVDIEQIPYFPLRRGAKPVKKKTADIAHLKAQMDKITKEGVWEVVDKI
jgi:hypothetical protein